MKIAIFYDSLSVSKANVIKEIVSSHKCSVALYDENSKCFFDVNKFMKDITHVIFLNENFNEKQPSFFMGYSIGAVLPMLLIGEKSKIPHEWLNLFEVISLESFDSYFKLEKKRFT